jgi:predicted RNase H-like HicB family nuclease
LEHIETERETDGRWLAEIMTIPGAMAYGDTEHEAIQAVKDLAEKIIVDRDRAASARTGAAHAVR